MKTERMMESGEKGQNRDSGKMGKETWDDTISNGNRAPKIHYEPTRET